MARMGRRVNMRARQSITPPLIGARAARGCAWCVGARRLSTEADDGSSGDDGQGMDATDSLAVAAALFAVALLSGALRRVCLTAPIACLALGFGLQRAGLVPAAAGDAALAVVAQATLAIVLFADASQTRFRALRRSAGWSARLLLIGMPLALVLGALTLAPLLPGWSLWQVALLAALLVPTDAALGQSLFADEGVPRPVREALTVESGLNDGLALPAIIFLGCAAVGYEHDLAGDDWLVFAAEQVSFGVLAGLAAGSVGGAVIALTGAAGAAGGAAILALVPTAFFGAEAADGNGFVAVFAAGLAFSATARLRRSAPDAARDHARAFMERDGLLMTMISFAYIGAILLPEAVERFSPAWGVGIALVLFVVRPAATVLAMAGTGTTLRTRLVLGWFGPRGLGTALFAVFVLSEFMALNRGPDIVAFATLTVAVSAILHGTTAFAASAFCGRDDGVGGADA